MEAVETGRAIVWSHDGNEQLLAGRDLLWARAGDRYVLLPFDGSSSLLDLVPFYVGMVADSLGAPLVLTLTPRQVVLPGLLQADAKRILLVCKLVDEIAGLAPELKVGLDGAGVGRAAAALFVAGIVDEGDGIGFVLAGGGAKGVEGYVGWPPGVAGEGRNLDESGLRGSSPNSYGADAGEE